MRDNKGTVYLPQHASFSKRTKHITVRVRYMHEQVEHGRVEVVTVPTQDQIADGNTKIFGTSCVSEV
ncbi:unnamed protein product [Discosporangium mesarthrocarpum]